MKFIGFYEYCPEDTDKCIEKLKQAMVEREQKGLPKVIFGPFSMGGEQGMLKGFTVYETDDMEELDKLTVFYLPELTFKFTPIEEQGKLAELWVKMKK